MKKLFQKITNLGQVIKDPKGQVSSKRAAGLTIIGLATADYAATGQISWHTVALCLIGGAVLVLGNMAESKSN